MAIQSHIGTTPLDEATSGGLMEECIRNCIDCYETCLEGCAEAARTGHIQHVTALSNCARICQTSAEFMISDSPHHAYTCQACAEICERCANECKDIGGFENCIKSCMRCADTCRGMAAQH